MSLTRNKPRIVSGARSGGLPVAAGVVIFWGAAVGSHDGYARPLVAGDRFAGFAQRKTDNAGGVAGSQSAELYAGGEVLLPVAEAEQSSVGESVYATDDDAFTLVPIGSRIGTIVRVPAAGRAVVAFESLQPGLAADQAGMVSAMARPAFADATYNGSGQLASYTRAGVEHTITYPDADTVVITNTTGAQVTINRSSGRVTAVTTD